MRFCSTVVFAVYTLLGFLTPLHATNEHNVTTSLISSKTSVGHESTITIGLRMQLAPGWHTYWRSPGAGGYGVKVDWSGSQNLKETQMAWPTPERFTSLGMPTLGYKEDVVFPITLNLIHPGKAVELKAHLDYLICTIDKCVPVQSSLTLKIGAGPAQTTPESEIIAAFQRRVPLDKNIPFMVNESSLHEDAQGNKSVRLIVHSQVPFVKPDVFMESPVKLFVDVPSITLNQTKTIAAINVPLYADETKTLAPFVSILGETVPLTIVDGERSYSLETVVKAEAISLLGWIILVGLAFGGGFILNFMPCVLPVLSLKIMSLMKYATHEKSAIRSRSLITSSGIIATFLSIALTLITVKAAGQTIFWGMQFQQPIFLSVLCLVILLFGLNLMGVFEFRIPSFFNTLLNKTNASSGHVQDFMEGVFATLLSTPCSAPLIGTAISFALSHGSFEIMSIFLVMSFGFSAPYFLLAVFPSVVKFMPRPGPWMVKLKKILSLALFGTLVWLLFVLSIQIGLSRTVYLCAGLAGVAALFWAYGRTRRIQFFVLLGWLGLAALSSISVYRMDIALKTASTDLWRPFDLNELKRSIKLGKTVFVDVTAEWCVTCKYNERIVLSQSKVHDAFKKKGVVAMRADWTTPSPLITSYLKSFNTYAIPFYVVYGPKNTTGLKLPQILTPDIVVNALNQVNP